MPSALTLARPPLLARMARGDALGDAKAIGREVHVVGDQNGTRADSGGAGGRMRLIRSEVGAPLGLLHAKRHAVHASSPNTRQASPVVGRRGLLVQEHRHVKALSDERGSALRQRHALFHRRTLQRNEGHHVDGADARMDAVVRAQVDRVDRRGEQAKYSVAERAGLARERVDRCGCARDRTTDRACGCPARRSRPQVRR